MSVKTFVELSGKTQSTGLDVLAFVDSGYTSTYQINKQTFLSSVLPLKFSNNGNNNIINAWGDYFAVGDNQYFATLMGGNEHAILGSGYYNTIIGGKRNKITSDFASGNKGIFGGSNNEITDTGGGGANQAIVGGNSNQILNSESSVIMGAGSSQINGGNNNGIFQARTSSIINSSDSAVIGGHSNGMNGVFEGVMAGGYSNSLSGTDSSLYGGRGNIIYGNAYRASIFGGIYNVINSVSTNPVIVGGYFNSITSTAPRGFEAGDELGIYSSSQSSLYGVDNTRWTTISTSSGTTIANTLFTSALATKGDNLISSDFGLLLGTSGNSVSFNNGVGIIGGKDNIISSDSDVNRSSNNYIIGSQNCRIEEDGQYTSDNITMINCYDMDVENQANMTYIGMSGQTYVNGGIFGRTTGYGNVVVMPSTYTIGTRLFSADTYTATTIQIDPRVSDHIIVNTDGSSTYNISFNPDPESSVYAQFTIYINYVSGSTINFANTTYSSWKWGNNLGAPTFSGTNANIIVVNTLKNNDVFEVSRSMYMA